MAARAASWTSACLAALLCAASCRPEAHVVPPPAVHGTVRPSATAQSRPPPVLPAAAPLEAAAILEHVRILTSDDMGGRAAGSEGERRAAEYVATVLEAARIPPPQRGRFHAFPLRPVKQGGPARSSRNVLGLLEGSNPRLRREIVVVGAHVDHLGVVRGRTYHGAEDNASGVAVTLEIARSLVASQKDLGRSVLFAFFGAEEIGLVGSRALVADPASEVERMMVMVNVDMIGRELADRAAFTGPKKALGIDSRRSVGIVGTKGRPLLRRIVDAACDQVGLVTVAPEDFPPPLGTVIEAQTRERGDNWSFESAGVPAVFFSSGESDDYHEPTDVASTLVPEILEERARAIRAAIVALSTADLASVRAPSDGPRKATSLPHESTSAQNDRGPTMDPSSTRPRIGR